MRFSITVVSTMFMALAITALFGCGSTGEEVVAVVGNYEITTREFNEFFQVRRPFPSAEEEFERRREVLDTVIDTRLLVQGAYERGIDRLEELARVVLANKDKLLIDVLAKRKVLDNSLPSEAELKEFWERLEYKTRASHILLDNVDTAEAILARIQAGENFEKLAHEYSTDPSVSKNRGDLGYFTWGSMVDEFQDAVWAMEPGQISPPVKSQFGYHIIKVIDRLPNEYRTEFENMKADLKKQVTQRKRRKLSETYFKEMKERYPVHVDTATCDYLLHKRQLAYPPMLLKTLPRNDFDIEQLDRSERELVMATWNGGQISVSEYLQLIKDLSPTLKPDLDDYDSLATFIFNLKLNDILVLESHREGIDNDPLYLEKVRLLKELAMADIMKNDSIPTPPEPDDGMLRAYYDEHPDEFTNPAKVHVYEILLSDELKARRLAKEIKSRQRFQSIAMDMTERPGKRAEKGDLKYIERKWFPEIFDEAIKTPIGEIGGPVQTAGKYSIFYVEDKVDAALKDYLGVKREIYAKLVGSMKKDAVQAWLNERRADTKIEVNSEALWATIDMEKYSSVPEESGN